MEKEVLFEKKNGVGVITIHRPKKLNSLNREVLEELSVLLHRCEEDPEIKLLLLEGSGDKAFCAGGDIRAVYEFCQNGEIQMAMNVFRIEYEMDFHISNYSKPIISYMNGITMGGGVGMSIRTGFRLVNERTLWAMPEMKIGFFPDVGVSFHLSRMKQGLGRYLALTSTTIGADDCLFLQLADIKIRSSEYERIKSEIVEVSHKWPTDEVSSRLHSVFSKYAQPAEEGYVERHVGKIEKHFNRDAVQEILYSLQSDLKDEFAVAALFEMTENSPLSMAVTLEQLKRAQTQSLWECFAQDLRLVRHFIQEEDFFTGIRTKMIEKTNRAIWRFKSVDEIPSHYRDHFFEG